MKPRKHVMRADRPRQNQPGGMIVDARATVNAPIHHAPREPLLLQPATERLSPAHAMRYNSGMSIKSASQALRLEPRFVTNIVRWERLPARAAETAPLPPGLGAWLVAAISARGITALIRTSRWLVEAALRETLGQRLHRRAR